MRMHQKPNRPAHDITQPFNSGIVKIHKTINQSKPGYKAVEALKDNPVTLRYDEQRTGITRYYAAKQANIQIVRVLRVPSTSNSTVFDVQDVAVTEDNMQYRIEQIQTVPGVYPPCVDISLSKIVQKLEVTAGE